LSLPIRSMTGYALVRRHTNIGDLTLSLRSVNHRGLDLHFHQNGELAQFENAMRSLLKQHIARGHVEVRGNLARDAQAVAYNPELLKHYLSLFRQACAGFDLSSEPDLNTFFTLPGVFESPREAKPLEKSFEAEVIGGLAECIDQLNAYREREGAELCSGLASEISALEEQAARISAIRSESVAYFVRRLRERLQELLQDASISETRLAEEAALLADKSDVQEELTRLTLHTQELRRILEGGGEVGKRLDFLLQEMNRETNTILSKTSGIGEAGLTITNSGLAIKANIERIREQALNLE
jgi:uncharacterized protein (TIGR00255 family)